MSQPYLIEHKPRQTQYRARRAKVTGLIVVHTAESAPDTVGPDTGTMNVAEFIRNRSDYGSYHWLADSDSRLQLVPHTLAAYGDGTGSNEFAIHVSAATQAARWNTLPKEWRDGCVRQMARAAAEAARWLKEEHGITVPAVIISKAQSDAGRPGFISHALRDPSRRSDPGPTFPWQQFFAEFKAEMAPPKPKPEPVQDEEDRVRVAHVSMQFSDTPTQMRQDVEKIFKRAVDRNYKWITGTEAGAGNPLGDILREVGEEKGYRLHIFRDVWIAVSQDFATGGWGQGGKVAVESYEGAGKHTDKGVGWVSFETKRLGRVSVAASHYLTKGRPDAKDPDYRVNLDENIKIAAMLGRWFDDYGKGADLAFYGGDQNIVDQTNDTFLGKVKATTSWDELKIYPGTGHGNIDVLASYDKDGRVRAVAADALDDKEFFLHTDHFLIETDWAVRRVG